MKQVPLLAALLLLLCGPEPSVSQHFEAFRVHMKALPKPVHVNTRALTVTKVIVPAYMDSLFDSGTLLDESDDAFTNITNPECISHIVYTLNELQGAFQVPPKVPETFVLQMLDAWGKLPSGIFSGHLAEPGDFEECVGARSSSSPNISEIIGKYCLAYVFPKQDSNALKHKKREHNSDGVSTNLGRAVTLPELLALMQAETAVGPLLPQVGTCFPASCDIQDVQQFLNNVLIQFNLSSVLMPCATEEKPPLDGGDITMIVVLAIIVGLCLTATLFDTVLWNLKAVAVRKEAKPMKALLAFSWYTNTTKWLSTRTGSDNLGCLHGLRFLSMCWVVLCHSWSMVMYQFPWNSVDVRRMYDSGPLIMTVINGYTCVDTFFVISGSLVAYNLLKELDKSQKVNVFMLYIHRYLRLTPTYAILLGILVTLLPYFGNGPMWSAIDRDSLWCEKNWWHNILYINSIIDYRNWGPESNMCFGESWYLSNDMIYFIVSPLFVYTLWRWRKIGFALLAAWLIQCTVTVAVTTAKNDISPVYVPFIRADTIMLDIYTRPWTRSAPYTIGIFLGYLLHHAKKHPNLVRALPKWTVAVGWVTSTVLALAVIFGPIKYFDPANQDEAFGTPAVVAYASLHRTAWAVAIAWIIFACVHGYGGWVDRFLSWKPFMPLGRLTYCVYISSYHLQLTYSFINYHPVHYSAYNMVYTFFAHLTVCLLVGYVLTVTIESPFMQLEKLIFDRSRRPPVSPPKRTAE